MKHKVQELEGALLDAAVAKAEGIAGGRVVDGLERSYFECIRDGIVDEFEPSRYWSDGGPIIERERIVLIPWTAGKRFDEKAKTVWSAVVTSLEWRPEQDRWAEFGGPRGEGAPTALVAAMRAYVIKRLGDHVDLP